MSGITTHLHTSSNISGQGISPVVAGCLQSYCKQAAAGQGIYAAHLQQQHIESIGTAWGMCQSVPSLGQICCVLIPDRLWQHVYGKGQNSQGQAPLRSTETTHFQRLETSKICKSKHLIELPMSARASRASYYMSCTNHLAR